MNTSTQDRPLRAAVTLMNGNSAPDPAVRSWKRERT
jgi:hypothetical protein